MRRSKKSDTGPPLSARVYVIEVPAKPEELLERYHTLALADAQRAAPFRRENVRRQHKKEHEYQEIQAIAKKLYTSDPELQRAKANRLAARIREKLRNRGRTVSIKTIVRALQQAKK